MPLQTPLVWKQPLAELGPQEQQSQHKGECCDAGVGSRSSQHTHAPHSNLPLLQGQAHVCSTPALGRGSPPGLRCVRTA